MTFCNNQPDSWPHVDNESFATVGDPRVFKVFGFNEPPDLDLGLKAMLVVENSVTW